MRAADAHLFLAKFSGLMKTGPIEAYQFDVVVELGNVFSGLMKTGPIEASILGSMSATRSE